MPCQLLSQSPDVTPGSASAFTGRFPCAQHLRCFAVPESTSHHRRRRQRRRTDLRREMVGFGIAVDGRIKCRRAHEQGSHVSAIPCRPSDLSCSRSRCGGFSSRSNSASSRTPPSRDRQPGHSMIETTEPAAGAAQNKCSRRDSNRLSVIRVVRAPKQALSFRTRVARRRLGDQGLIRLE